MKTGVKQTFKTGHRCAACAAGAQGVPNLAVRLEVGLDKHVEVLADGVRGRVPEVDALEEREGHRVVADGEPEAHRAAQVLHRHGCTGAHKSAIR